jgi:hypothetical protein
MYTIKQDSAGWSLVYDGFALFKGLTLAGIETILAKYQKYNQ